MCSPVMFYWVALADLLRLPLRLFYERSELGTAATILLLIYYFSSSCFLFLELLLAVENVTGQQLISIVMLSVCAQF